ncbi:N-acetyltransferase [Sphingobacterium sp. DR205]|uniref:N-acetyltransferase n=1 Tax=Sphingobacterium sp. DR205 TaxID=2713573 RepID=UPI0013E52274|nr:N-acetyltransferase [Sphingobacterium sp. DR205]QIH34602.1 N-acetyltransferase [Sphingobacterium sp. DR205]
MNIVTKFAIATDESTDILLHLTKELATEKFTTILDTSKLMKYTDEQFNRKYLVSEMNNISNQWLVTYVDSIAVGYAKITSRGKVPPLLDGKRAVRIADFSILQQYPALEIRESLFAKCLSLCRNTQAIWVNEYIGNPIIDFFETKGFVRQRNSFEFDEIKLESICLIYQNEGK